MKTFLIFYFLNLFLPVLMIIAGNLMFKKTPKKINGIYGYRTTMSMLSDETWSFAHEVCGKLWIKIGRIMLIIFLVIQLPFYFLEENTIAVVGLILFILQSVVLVISIFPVEKALNQTFNKDGTRK